MRKSFMLVGSGWRAEFFIRVAQFLPEYFEISSIVTKNVECTKRYSDLGVKCFAEVSDAVSIKTPNFAVVSVKAQVMQEVVLPLLNREIPVLMETPAGTSLDNLLSFVSKIPKGAKLQVAEQYHLRPDHMARMNIISSGKIGRPVSALVSLTNNYHAISLIRKYLGVSGVNAKIRAQRFNISGMPGFGREGAPSEYKVTNFQQTLATFDFGDSIGIYDFEDAQHRSYTRSQRIQIKCENGEINNNHIKYILDSKTPMEASLMRRNKGENENMEGAGLKGIIADGMWVYENPFLEARLTDDEIAVAKCLLKMSEYCDGKPSFYSFFEAAQDSYLSCLIEEAIAHDKTVCASPQPWSEML